MRRSVLHRWCAVPGTRLYWHVLAIAGLRVAHLWGGYVFSVAALQRVWACSICQQLATCAS
jgi:hypothetical protein